MILLLRGVFRKQSVQTRFQSQSKQAKIFTLMEQAKNTLRAILISGMHRTVTVEETAAAVSVSASLVYQWCDPYSCKRPTCDQVLFLSKWFLSEHGDARLASLFVPSEWEIIKTHHDRLNGSLDDEIAEMVERAGAARTFYRAGDMEAAATHAQAVIDLASTMLEEVRARQ